MWCSLICLHQTREIWAVPSNLSRYLKNVIFKPSLTAINAWGGDSDGDAMHLISVVAFRKCPWHRWLRIFWTFHISNSDISDNVYKPFSIIELKQHLSSAASAAESVNRWCFFHKHTILAFSTEACLEYTMTTINVQSTQKYVSTHHASLTSTAVPKMKVIKSYHTLISETSATYHETFLTNTKSDARD